MSKTVFILGAGASKRAGAPLMNEFLDRAKNLYDNDEIPDDYREDFKRVFQAVSNLQKIHSKSNIDINNIEEVFSIFEMASLLNKFPGYDIEKFSKERNELLSSMKRLIYMTLVKSTPLDLNQNINEGMDLPSPKGSYANFIKVFWNIKKVEKEFPSIITFNYDLMLDYTLMLNGLMINYGLCTEKNENEKIYLFKLHGSLNWFTSKKNDNNISPFDLIKTIKEISKNKNPNLYESYNFNKGPVIIPPTWDKSKYRELLSKVWTGAAYNLAEAENIFIIGYSLPLTDNFFRYLYSIGTEGEKAIRRFWVFNPNETNVKRKYEDFIGTGVKERFEYIPLTFNYATKILSDVYKNYHSPNINYKTIIEKHLYDYKKRKHAILGRPVGF